MSFGTVSKPKRVLVAIILCSVSIMAFWPTSLPAYGQSETSAIRGYVVDEDGVVLSGVTVELISDGAISADTFTNPHGYFVIDEIEFGMYSLRLKKLGYVEVVKSITLQTEPINIGTTVLFRALKLSTSTLRLVSNLGNQVTIPFTAQNSGEETEVVDFLISSPNEWSARVIAQSYEVTKVSLAPGQSMSLQLEITVPLTASLDRDYNISLTAIGITNSSLMFTILTCTQPTATVSGRIVDEYGNGIQVAVDSCLSDGTFIQSAETSSDGYFTIELPIGTAFSLHFSKDGYVTATETVSFESAGEKLELGEIVISEALTLFASVLNTVANPGEKLLLPFVVSNIGEDIELVEFSVSDSNEWSAKISSQNGREIKSAALSPSSTLNLQLEVTVPLASDGANNLTLTAIGKTVSTIDFLINVEPTSESMLFCRFPGKWAIPGDPIAFQVELKNHFDVEMRFKVSVDSVPTNWSSSVKTADNEYVTEMILGADESIALTVELNSPASATPDRNYEVSVNVESNDQNLGSLPLIISLIEPESIEEIVINTKFPEVTVEAGETVNYQIQLGNFGDLNRLLFLSIEAPPDWKAVFKSGTLEISQLDIAPMSMGGAEDLAIEVTPPSTVNLDTYNISVQAKSETGAVLAETELKATIIGSYDLKLSMSTLLTSTTSGGSASFTATVINTGFSSLTVVGLDIEVEENWDVEISPMQLDLLKPQESFSFNVVIDTPKDTVSGDYLVTLTGLSDQVDSSPIQVRVTVNTPTEWGIYGFGIAIVIIIALVLVFRKFKRR
ncbi:MAG: NEW3 domain-containing protein [Candidatus Bathyarchaeota archaeon]|jgi:uncharacterized membrane protein